MVLITIKSGNDPQFLFDVPAKESDKYHLKYDTESVIKIFFIENSECTTINTISYD